MTEMIALDRLTKRFGALTAVDGVTMTVGRGEVLGFLGPNGAGKSTTMKMVAGFLEPTSGSARVCGIDVVSDPIAAKRTIGYLPEGAPAYGDMTVGSFLSFVADVRGFSGREKSERIDRAVERTELHEVLDQAIDTLSKGFKRRVGLAQAILHDPEVMILDEPTDGLDPVQKHQVRNLIREMAADKAIVISTHILEEVDAVCTRAAVIAKGRLLADSTPDELAARAFNHNAVILGVDEGTVDGVKSALSGVAGVNDVQRIGGGDGLARLRILPKDGAILAPAIGEAMRDGNLTFREMYVERGALDQVFRDIADSAESGGAAHA